MLTSFDLDYFRVRAFTQQTGRIVADGTTTKLLYHFISNTMPTQSDLRVTITAVSKCNQESLGLNATEQWEDVSNLKKGTLHGCFRQHRQHRKCSSSFRDEW